MVRLVDVIAELIGRSVGDMVRVYAFIFVLHSFIDLLVSSLALSLSLDGGLLLFTRFGVE